jgi:hypothetical protein
MMQGKRYAVLIGNGKYPEDARLQPLRCPAQDIDDLEKVLKSKEYGDFDEVLVLKDAPQHESQRTLLHVLRSARREDLVLIYYSGHGKLGLEGGLHLATFDTNIDTLEATSIPVDRIRGFLRASPTSKVILILDCCYSGKVGEAFLKGGGVEDQLAQIQSEGRGTYILTASSGLEVAQEKPEDQNSLLTKYILEGIREGKADFDDKGSVSIGDLYRYASEQIKKTDFQKPMKWDLGVEGADLVVAHTGKVSGERRREQIEQVLYSFRKEGSLPRLVLKKALEILDLERDQLSEAQVGHNILLDRLGQDRIKINDFVFEWRALDQRIEDDLKRKEMKTLYRMAKDAKSVEDWSLALDTSKQLLALDPTYADAPDILEEAQKKLESLQLYATGKEHHKQSRWAEALSALMQIQSDSGNYEDAKALIGTAEAALARDRAEAQRQAETEIRESQLVALYDEGKKLYDAAQFQEALACFYPIVEIDPDYRDIKILREKAAEESERVKREAEEEAAWRTKAELERLEREELARREAEAKARRAQQLETERVRKDKEQRAHEIAEAEQKAKEEREQMAAEAATRCRAQEEKTREAIQRLEEKRRQPATEEARGKDPVIKIPDNKDLKRDPETSSSEAVQIPPAIRNNTQPLLANKKTGRNEVRIIPTRGCAFSLLTISLLLFGTIGPVLYYSNFRSLGSGFLFLVAIIVLGVVGLIFLGLSIDEFGLGKAPCPNCGAKLENLGVSNDGLFCNNCETYLEGFDRWLWPTDDNRIADTPIFNAQLTNDKLVFPPDCCVCGKKAVRQDIFELSRQPGSPGLYNITNKFSSVAVPHCAEHTKGVVFEEKQGKAYLKFRSHAYWKAFSKVNEIIPGTVN